MKEQGWSPGETFAHAMDHGLGRLVTFKAILEHWGTEPFHVQDLEAYEQSHYPSAAAKAAVTVGLAALVLNYRHATVDDFADFEDTTGIGRKVEGLARADRVDDALGFYDRLEIDRLRLRPIDEPEARETAARAVGEQEGVLAIDDTETMTFPWGWVFTYGPVPATTAGGSQPGSPGTRAVIVDRYTGALIELGESLDVLERCAHYEATGWPVPPADTEPNTPGSTAADDPDPNAPGETAAAPVTIDPEAGQPIEAAIPRPETPSATDQVHEPGPAPAPPGFRTLAGRLMTLAADETRAGRLAISADRSHERYDPALHLDGCLPVVVAAAHRLGRRTALVIDGDGLCYDPVDDVFISTGYFDWLDRLAASGAPCWQYITTDASGLFLAERSRQNPASVLWRASLFSGRGRLRTGVVEDDPLRLRRWPDLTRLTIVAEMLPVLADIATSSPSITRLVRDGHRAHVVNATVGALAAIDALHLSPELRNAWITRPESPSRPLLTRLLRRNRQ